MLSVCALTFSFRRLLLQYRLAKVDESWQACSLHEAVQRMEFHAELWLPWQPKDYIFFNLKKYSFDIWYVTSSSGPLQLFKLCP